MQQPIVIRKYSNRRLYNTASRRYVNLEDLATMIRKGLEIQVLDVKTGEDLTRVILTQIIVEDAKDQPTGLPLELLRQLIMASDRAGQEFLMWYLKSAFDTYQKVQETVQDRLSDVREAAFSPINAVKSFLSGPPSSAADAEMERLRRRVAELEALEPKAKPRKRSGKSGTHASDR